MLLHTLSDDVAVKKLILESSSVRARWDLKKKEGFTSTEHEHEEQEAEEEEGTLLVTFWHLNFPL